MLSKKLNTKDFPLIKYIYPSAENNNFGIYNAIQSNKIIALQAPTGSGKSLLIPYIFANNAKSNVIVVESKSSIALALYQAQLLLSENDVVGYTNNYESFISKKDKGYINYYTSNFLLNEVLENYKNNKLPFGNAGLLILDDSTDVNSSILEYLWNYFNKQNIKVPRLIIMSATLDIDMYQSLGVTTIKIDSKSNFNVKVFYNDKDYDINNNFMYNDLVYKINQYYNNIKTRGSYLVFCPGKQEITLLANKLKELNLKDVKIIEVYAAIAKQSLKEINEQSYLNKIIITTNVFESAITLDVDGVFDTMIEKRLYTLDNDSVVLKEGYISKDSSIQRRGRVGRIKDGFYFMMMTKNKYDTLPEKLQPVIYRIPIYNQIVKLIINKIDINELFPIDLINKVNTNINTLLRLDIIKKIGENKDGNPKYIVTKIGYNLIENINIRLSVFLYNWSIDNAKYLGNLVTAIIDGYDGGVFTYVKRLEGENNRDYYARVEQENIEMYKKYESNNDLSVYVKIFKDLIKSINIIEGKVNNWEVRNWCKNNNMDYNKINNILRKLLYLNKEKKVNIIKEFNADELVNKVKSYLKEVYYNRILRLKLAHNEYLIYIDENSAKEYNLISNNLAKRAILRDKPNYIINFYDFKTPNNTNIVNFSLPVADESYEVKLIVDYATNDINEKQNMLIDEIIKSNIEVFENRFNEDTITFTDKIDVNAKLNSLVDFIQKYKITL